MRTVEVMQIIIHTHRIYSPSADDMIAIYCEECTTFAPATIAPVITANVKRNPNPNPKPNLNHYPTPNQKPNYPHSSSLLSEISSPEQLSPEQNIGSPLRNGANRIAMIRKSKTRGRVNNLAAKGPYPDNSRHQDNSPPCRYWSWCVVLLVDNGLVGSCPSGE